MTPSREMTKLTFAILDLRMERCDCHCLITLLKFLNLTEMILAASVGQVDKDHPAELLEESVHVPLGNFSNLKILPAGISILMEIRHGT